MNTDLLKGTGARQPRHVILVSVVYFLIVTGLLMQALAGKSVLTNMGN